MSSVPVPPLALSHVTADGAARMVDVSDKVPTVRTARAEAFVSLLPETRRLIGESAMKKGDVLGVARIAGIQAAKRTSDLIPLCHPLALTKVDVDVALDDNGARIEAAVRCHGATGVEMEALTAVTVAALTVYDMVKAVDREAVIGPVRLIEKTGGKSDFVLSREAR